jgi:hypothetical protein
MASAGALPLRMMKKFNNSHDLGQCLCGCPCSFPCALCVRDGGHVHARFLANVQVHLPVNQKPGILQEGDFLRVPMKGNNATFYYIISLNGFYLNMIIKMKTEYNLRRKNSSRRPKRKTCRTMQYKTPVKTVGHH